MFCWEWNGVCLFYMGTLGWNREWEWEWQREHWGNGYGSGTTQVLLRIFLSFSISCFLFPVFYTPVCPYVACMQCSLSLLCS